MQDTLTRFVSDLVGRLDGPFSFRFVLQPVVAMIYAARDGLADAREGRPPYFWALFTRPDQRRLMLREGWKAVTRVIVLGVVMDTTYQVIEFRWIHPLQLMVIVVGLAFVPYVLLRGPIGRLATWWTTRKAESEHHLHDSLEQLPAGNHGQRKWRERQHRK